VDGCAHAQTADQSQAPSGGFFFHFQALLGICCLPLVDCTVREIAPSGLPVRALSACLRDGRRGCGIAGYNGEMDFATQRARRVPGILSRQAGQSA